jgi:hypothetical protein
VVESEVRADTIAFLPPLHVYADSDDFAGGVRAWYQVVFGAKGNINDILGYFSECVHNDLPHCVLTCRYSQISVLYRHCMDLYKHFASSRLWDACFLYFEALVARFLKS